MKYRKPYDGSGDLMDYAMQHTPKTVRRVLDFSSKHGNLLRSKIKTPTSAKFRVANKKNYNNIKKQYQKQARYGFGKKIYRTRGYVGKFPKSTKKKQYKFFDLNGATKKVETGGVFEAATSQSIYIGHGTAPKKIRDSVCRAIFKKLFAKAGVCIQDWVYQFPTKGVGNILNIIVEYTDTDNYTVYTSFAFPVSATDNWETNATNFAAAWETAWGVATYQAHQIRLVETTGAGSNISLERAILRCADITLEFDILSVLSIQNRTLATHLTGGAADNQEEVFNNITNNPLIGKVYTPKKWTTGFMPASRGPTAGIKPFQLTAGSEFGLINVGSSEATNQYPLLAQKPPPSWFFDSTRGANLKLDPGQIKKSVVKFRATITFNTFLLKAPTIMASSNVYNSIIPFGKCELIGLEKMLDSRDEVASKIALGYELNQIYKCAIKLRNNNRSIPIIQVDTTAQDNKYPA